MQTTFSLTKRSSSISINFIVPGSWEEMSDKQLRYVYQLMVDNFSTDEVKTLFLLKWSGTKVIDRQVLAADFQGVPFETFIVCDNYFQEYSQTQQEYLLDEICRAISNALSPDIMRLTVSL